MGKRRLIKQNKIFISIIAILFILFGFILYFGGNQIYEKEAKWQHGNTVARLLSGREIIEKYFSEFKHNLFFLSDLPANPTFAIRGVDKPLSQKIQGVIQKGRHYRPICPEA
jgi:putative two-component system response regulator